MMLWLREGVNDAGSPKGATLIKAILSICIAYIRISTFRFSNISLLRLLLYYWMILYVNTKSDNYCVGKSFINNFEKYCEYVQSPIDEYKMSNWKWNRGSGNPKMQFGSPNVFSCDISYCVNVWFYICGDVKSYIDVFLGDDLMVGGSKLWPERSQIRLPTISTSLSLSYLIIYILKCCLKSLV